MGGRPASRSMKAETVAEVIACVASLVRLASRDAARVAAALAALTAAARSGQGNLLDLAIRAVRLAGYDDAQIIEIVMHVALNTWTNYLNSVAATEIDFPVVATLAA